MLATYTMFKKDINTCYPFAVAMEMVHNFSLIHDDLPGIDNDDIRHGKLTNHKKFNESTAILAGDALLNYAYLVIAKSMQDNIDLKIKCLNELSCGIDKMIAGEYLDTECENKQISKELLEYIHKNKTGELIKASVRIGAILGEANEEQLNDLTIYADKIGLAFQIKDDILSEIGDTKKTGKPVGNDKSANKCTFVSMYGIEKSKQILQELTNDAVLIMDKFLESGEFLKELAKFIQNREK